MRPLLTYLKNNLAGVACVTVINWLSFDDLECMESGTNCGKSCDASSVHVPG